MSWKSLKLIAVVILMAAVLCLTASAQRDKEKAGETERKVTEADVPKAALRALKRQARKAEITEFAEETEHGSTFYEASWKNKAGANFDVLVTKAGALVEIEETIPADEVPAAALKAAKKAAGKNAELACEKKTMILYEVKFSKDGASHELLLTPDGRVVEEGIEKGKSEDEDGNGNGDAKHDDDDDEDEDDDEDGDDDDEDGDDDDEDEDDDEDDDDDDDEDDDDKANGNGDAKHDDDDDDEDDDDDDDDDDDEDDDDDDDDDDDEDDK